ncbi:MAG: 1-phosphofructokinase family hexose kinase [bacterium]
MISKTPIATLTLNPAVDVSHVVQEMVPDTKVRATESRVDPGGNGINVARVLHKLGYHVYPCCAIAGETGKFLIEMLQQRMLRPEFLELEGETRTNITIQQRRPPQEYKVGGVGPAITDDQVEEISQCYLKRVADGYGVLSGSLTSGSPMDIYASLTEKINEQGGRAIVDAHGEMLLNAIESKPFLVKPNRHELELLSGHTLSTPEALAEEARRLQAKGVANVCVSLGSEGALLVDAENAYFAKPPKIHVRCTTGVGDSMIAGLIAAFVNQKSCDQVLAFGVACGTSAATQPGTALIDPVTLPKLKAEVETLALDI